MHLMKLFWMQLPALMTFSSKILTSQQRIFTPKNSFSMHTRSLQRIVNLKTSSTPTKDSLTSSNSTKIDKQQKFLISCMVTPKKRKANQLGKSKLTASFKELGSIHSMTRRQISWTLTKFSLFTWKIIGLWERRTSRISGRSTRSLKGCRVMTRILLGKSAWKISKDWWLLLFLRNLPVHLCTFQGRSHTSELLFTVLFVAITQTLLTNSNFWLDAIDLVSTTHVQSSPSASPSMETRMTLKKITKGRLKSSERISKSPIMIQICLV